MKNYRLLLFGCILLLPLLSYSQSSPHTWVDYSKTYYKLSVAKDGVYRITYEALVNSGLPLDPQQLKMYARGQEVPIHISSSSTLQAGDYIEFYGEKLDGFFDQQFYDNPKDQLNPNICLFSDSTSYYLTADPSGSTPLRYETITNDIANAPPKETHFIHHNHSDFVSNFSEGVPYDELGGFSNYLSSFGIGEGLADRSIEGQTSITYQMPTQSIYNNGQNAFYYFKIAGRSNDAFSIPDHHLRVTFNNETKVDTFYEGHYVYKFSKSIPLNDLIDFNSVNFASLQDGFSSDRNALVYHGIKYPHSFDFEGKSRFFFTLENNRQKYIEIEHFSGGSQPILYDLTNRLRIQPVEQNGLFKFHLPAGNNGNSERQLYFTSTDCLFNTCQVEKINSLKAVEFVDYSKVENQGDYMILSHPLLMQGEVDYVEEYRKYRSSPEGGNYQAVVVDVTQLYDQYGYGIYQHPLAIKHFINNAIETWEIKPDYLLLLGKSIEYNKFTKFESSANNKERYLNLVPSYGHRAADMELSATFGRKYANRLATGRIPAKTSEEVRAYLNKVKVYETPLPCTKEDRQWLKQGIHIAGGFSNEEAEDFTKFLNAYERTFGFAPMGGDVVFTYSKASSDAIENPELDHIINKGVGIISFVGHSSSQYWSVSLNEPQQYQNYGRFPLVLSSSCFVGDVHDLPSVGNSMAEDYVLADSLGSIGFLATVAYGFPTYMNIYMSQFYEQFCNQNYGKPIGYCLRESVSKIENQFIDNGELRYTAQQFIYVGDPAVRIISFDRPELLIEESDVFIEPVNVTANLEKFTVNVVLNNLGKGSRDSVDISINRTLPDGELYGNYTKRVPIPPNVDTFSIDIPVGESAAIAGNNSLSISIDPSNQVEEDCEDNNQVNTNLFIFADLLIPIFPCNQSVLNTEEVKLMASTGQPLMARQPFKLQIDTSASFDRPLADTAFQSLSGVIEWEPAIDFEPGTVYYWRATQLTSSLEVTNWETSSFLYAPNAASGWNQSHYDQFLSNTFNNVYLDNDRIFKFTSETNHIRTTTGIGTGLNAISVIQNFSNQLISSSCLFRACVGGVNILAFRPSTTLEPMTTQQKSPGCNTECGCFGTYNNIQCSGGERYGFEYYTGDQYQVRDMLNFINNEIPEGYYVLMYNSTEHRFGTNDPNEATYGVVDSLANFFILAGIAEMQQVTPQNAFVAFGRKGHPTYEGYVQLETKETGVFDADITAEGYEEEGNISSTVIGPSSQWKQLLVNYSSTEPDLLDEDVLQISIYGISNTGNESLIQTIQAAELPLDLTGINAQQYPFLRFETQLKDAKNLSPSQINFWRIEYDQVGELALNRRALFEVTDTLFEGETFRLRYAITNASLADMVGVQLSYQIKDANNNLQPIRLETLPLIKAGETQEVVFETDTKNLNGTNYLDVTINKGMVQLEKMAFNNRMTLPFFVKKDQVNPIIDVTFDGRHILDGELVSAKPEILVRLTDDNVFLPLNQAEDFDIMFRCPDENGEPTIDLPVATTDDIFTFIPPSGENIDDGNNQAQVELRPNFTKDGRYELIIQALDRSGNSFSDARRAYSITFEVITAATVTNVLNYPNPFTSSTRFVFHVTGSEVPTFMKIQIMTPSGKVVREITQDELGTVQVGRNISEYAWDGTDEYGNLLANGVYLYRVVTKMNQQQMDLYEQERVDDLFKKGIGKMYIMR